MPRSLFILGLLVLTVGCDKFFKTEDKHASENSTGGPSTRLTSDLSQAQAQWTKNPWWPLTPGNSWTFQKSDNGHPLKITVQPQQDTFGCGQYPIHLFFEKHDLDAYWGPTSDMNLHWYLGMRPDGTLMGYGHQVSNYATGEMMPGTMNYRSMDASFPAYYLLPGVPYNNQFASGRHALPATDQITNDCLPDDNNFYSTWNVTWKYTTVSTPAYTGPALMASYDELSGSRQIEDWYFAHGIGIVRIVAKSSNGDIGVDMQLTSYELYEPTTVVAKKSGFRATAVSDARPERKPTLQVLAGINTTPGLHSDILEAKVGDRLNLAWTSANAADVTSFQSADRSDSCPDGLPTGATLVSWVVDTLSGSKSLDIKECQAGHTYNYTVQATSEYGDVVPKTITVHVANAVTEPEPTVHLSFSEGSEVHYKEANVGDTVSYFWNVQNAARIESYYYVNATDTCPGGFGPLATLKPWVQINPGSGAGAIRDAVVDACQAAREYTIFMVAYSESGSLIGRDQILLHISGDLKQQMEVAGNVSPQTWYTWVWWYKKFSGRDIGGLETFVNVAPGKSLAKISLDTWWNCTQLNNCADMIRVYSDSITLTTASYAYPTVNSLEGKAYAILKGVGFSTGSDNRVVSNCPGLEKVYDGADGGAAPETRQINVRVDAQMAPANCNFQVISPDGATSNTITLLMPALPVTGPKITNQGPGCDACRCGWIMGGGFISPNVKITVRTADWQEIAEIDPSQVAYNGTTSMSFILPMAAINQYPSGLRFTAYNAALGQWDTSDVVRCSP